MNFLSVEECTKSFGDRYLFEDLTFGIEQGQKAAIVAKNGSGKTTLLRCLLGQESIDSGRVVFRKDLRIAFMEQGENLNESNTILEEIFAHDLPELKAVKDYNRAMRLEDEDLIAASKKKALNWGVAQIGGTEHIGLAQFAKEAGIKFKVVPFGSGAQMVQALMAGKIDATLPNVSEAANQVADGSFRALAVMAEERLKDYPNVPSTYEKGIKAKCSTTRGYAVLASTPQPIIDQISKAMVKAMKHDVFASYLAGAGLTVESSVAGTKVWDKHLKAEYQIASSALKELGLVK